MQVSLVKVQKGENGYVESSEEKSYVDLYVDERTKIVYIVHSIYFGMKEHVTMCPYLGPTGKICKLINGKILEFSQK